MHSKVAAAICIPLLFGENFDPGPEWNYFIAQYLVVLSLVNQLVEAKQPLINECVGDLIEPGLKTQKIRAKNLGYK